MDKHKDNLDNPRAGRYMKLLSILWESQDWYLFTLSNLLHLFFPLNSPGRWSSCREHGSFNSLPCFLFKGVHLIWKLIWWQIEALLFSPASGSHLQWSGVRCTLCLVFRWDGSLHLSVVEDTYVACVDTGIMGLVPCCVLFLWFGALGQAWRGGAVPVDVSKENRQTL